MDSEMMYDLTEAMAKNLGLLAAAFGLVLAASSAQAQDKHFYLGPRTPRVDVTKVTGFGTENAVAEGTITEAAAREFCETFRVLDTPEETKECIAGKLAQYGKTYRVTADCVAGSITSVYGETFYYVGQRVRRSDTDSPNISLWKDEEGETLDFTRPYDPGHVVAQNWSTVCGASHRPDTHAQLQALIKRSNKAGTGKAQWTMGPRKKGFDGLSYLHNGSYMLVDERHGEIRYEEPKRAIAGTVAPGTVLFRGSFSDTESDPTKGYAKGVVKGTAYTFKKGCPPAPYEVEGTYDSGTITLRGQAPKRDKNLCAVLGTTSNSPHTVLRFEEAPIGD